MNNFFLLFYCCWIFPIAAFSAKNQHSYYQEAISFERFSDEEIESAEKKIQLLATEEDYFSDTDSISEYIADAAPEEDNQPYNLQKQCVELAKDMGLRLLLFMLDAKDYAHSSYNQLVKYLSKK